MSKPDSARHLVTSPGKMRIHWLGVAYYFDNKVAVKRNAMVLKPKPHLSVAGSVQFEGDLVDGTTKLQGESMGRSSKNKQGMWELLPGLASATL
jgi:hypothetical protein